MWKSSIARRGTLLGALLVFGVGTPVVPSVTTQVAHAAKPDNAAEMKAREAFAAGRYEEALELFAKLYAQTLHPVYLRNIARCHQKLRQPEKAIDQFREYLAKEKKISAEERKEIEGYIKEMEALRDEQARQATPPPPANPPPPLVTPINNPPPPTYYPPPPPTTSGMLVAQPPPPQAEAPIYTKWWFWAGIGALVATGVVAAILLSGGTQRPDCPASALECR